MNKSILILMAIGSLSLVGCATGQGGTGLLQMTAPDGQPYYRVKCNGSEQDCLAQANEACAGTYQVVTSESHAGGLLADWIPGPVKWYSMHFACGPSDGSFPTFPHNGPTFAEAWDSYQDRLVAMEIARQQNRPLTTTCTGNNIAITCTTQ